MSDLSFLIENQKEVEVDNSYLQKCKGDETEKQRSYVASPSNISRVLSSRQLKINTNFVPNKKKPNSPRSYATKNFSSVKSETSDGNEQLFKIGIRVEALQQNQKRMEQRYSKQFANLHNAIYGKKTEYSDLMAELNGIQSEINESKKIIGHVLNDITSKGKP